LALENPLKLRIYTRFLMRFSALTVVSLAFAGLLLGCGETQRDLSRADYQGWLNKVNTPVSIDPTLMDGMWMLGAESFLYSDRYDSRYDTATGRQMDESGDLLLINGNRITRGQIPLWCPLPNAQHSAQWMVDIGYSKDAPESSLALDMPSFVAAAQTRGPAERWDTFGLSGQAFATGKKFRGQADKVDHDRDGKPLPGKNTYRMSITELAPHRLEITYRIQGPFDGGVHTIIEIYKPLAPREFMNLLKKSSEMKPCDVKR
jgi:hypothetical protein